MFDPLPGKLDFPQLEKDVLAFWKARAIFHQSLERRRGAPRFVFYEGPPTANGMPHPGHCLTRAMKDIFPRYKTMTGCLVERKAGWDTHGLPVEVEVCKELGIHTKAEIEAYGVEPFVRRCIESVFRYTREWEEMTERLAFWVDMDDAYATYNQAYVESVWWSLRTLFDRGLLYQGHKVVWWWPQGGTALSAGEVGEGYRTIDDPSVYVRFPLRDEDGASLLVWTTTPWTLVSNHFAAVHPELTYAKARDAETGEVLYIAAALVGDIAAKVGRSLEVVAELPGTNLVGRPYTPPFDVYFKDLGERTAALSDGGAASVGWRVLAADFVTIDSGTGLVHEAPAFGEVDFELLQSERRRFVDPDAIPLLCAVAPDGSFTEEAGPDLAGRNIKEADRDVVRALRERGLLYHRESYRHDYPFCPRAEEDPLIQYARASWFVRTSRFKEAFLANNAAVNWLPEHIKSGRFGDFLRNNVDWALSRERYWGTPLPIWRCEATGHMEAVGSFAELLAKPGLAGTEVWDAAKTADPGLLDDLRIHKPYIDAITYDSPKAAGARMRRVPEVIDCWWDAGSMPFAQWGYPHQPGSAETFAQRFPADFISEAIDQTRGWFYGLLSISTLLFGREDGEEPARSDEAGTRDGHEDNDSTGNDGKGRPDAPDPAAGAFTTAGAFTSELPHPYRTCIVLGHMAGEDGLKMSKRKRNYREPTYIFDTLGADAMRWYFFSAQPPWTSVRFQEAAIRDAQREFLVRLYNVFSFFNIYAAIDGFDPGLGGPDDRPTGWRPVPERAELDRWITSELHRTAQSVRASMDAFENYPAAQRLTELVDALSNWYVRRSRDRFWTADKGQDKWDAYNTLYETLVTTAKLIAPFTPFLAEVIYRNLVAGPAAHAGSLGAGVDGGRGAGAGVAGAGMADRQGGGNPASGVPESVHLCDYPVADSKLVDDALSAEMDLVRQLVSLGHAARADAGVKVRQPLAQAEVILARPEAVAEVRRHAALIAEELNVRHVAFTADADQYVTYQVRPDFKLLGPKLGRRLPLVQTALRDLDAAAARRALAETGRLEVPLDGEVVVLTGEEIEVRLEARPGWSAAQGRAGVVVLGTEITPELREEGLVRELIAHVQAARKAGDLAYVARIRLALDAPPEFLAVVDKHAAIVRRECLVTAIVHGVDGRDGVREAKVDGQAVKLAIEVEVEA